MTHISRAVNRSPVLGTIFGEVYTHLEYNILHTDTQHSYTNFTAKFLICIHFKDSIFYVNATDNEVAVWMCLCVNGKTRTDKIIIKYKSN